MKKTILITAASTLLLASGSWAGGPYPTIDAQSNNCWILEQGADSPALMVDDHNITVTDRERGNGIIRLTATCKGNDPDLISDPDFKKPEHYDDDYTGGGCRILYGLDTHWTRDWRQTLRANGDFYVRCIKIIEPSG